MRLLLATIAALAAFTLPAVAANVTNITSCDLVDPDVTNLVTPTDACWVIDADDNVNSNFTYDGDALTMVGTVESPGTSGDLFIDGDTQSGTWSILNFDADLTYFLVFKDGTNALPGSQVGYRLDAQTGDYTTPFYNDAEGTSPKDISFWALFTSEGDGPITRRENPPSPVPLPASMWLLIGGLGMLAGARHAVRKAG